LNFKAEFPLKIRTRLTQIWRNFLILAVTKLVIVLILLLFSNNLNFEQGTIKVQFITLSVKQYSNLVEFL